MRRTSVCRVDSTNVLSVVSLCDYTCVAMLRIVGFVCLTATFALAAIACASDDPGSPLDATAIDATTAAAPADQEAYRLSVIGQGIVQETCAYNVDGALADCGERGVFKVEPPPAYADPSCVVGLSGGSKPEFVLCSNPAGGGAQFFVIPP